MRDAHFIAMAGTLIVFFAARSFIRFWLEVRDEDPSPTLREGVRMWVNSLLGRDTDRDPDPDTEDGAGDELPDHEQEPVEEQTSWGVRIAMACTATCPRCAIDAGEDWDDMPPPAEAPKKAGYTELERWIIYSYRNGAKYSVVVEQARLNFGSSESTTKRAIRRLKGAGVIQ